MLRLSLFCLFSSNALSLFLNKNLYIRKSLNWFWSRFLCDLLDYKFTPVERELSAIEHQNNIYDRPYRRDLFANFRFVQTLDYRFSPVDQALPAIDHKRTNDLYLHNRVYLFV